MSLFGSKTPAAPASRDYADRAGALDYVLDGLEALDKGEPVSIDFISTPDVDRFCKTIGFKKSWAGRTLDDIAPKDKDAEVNICTEQEGRIVLDLMKETISQERFASREKGEGYDLTILNDFLPKGESAGEPSLGHLWEWRYALAVELEHGRTRGANVTNNHPLLTGLVVLAHLTEDTLYYARLQCLEREGEIGKAIREGGSDKEIGHMTALLERARLYLARRVAEKLGDKVPTPA
jgi:hypothetical protein